MWNQLTNKQKELEKEINARNKLIRKKEYIKEQLLKEEKKMMDLKRQFSKEQQDVHDLDRFSFVNLYRNISGNMDKVREKEIAEAAQSELKWDEAFKLVQDLKEDVTKINKDLLNPNWSDIDNKWERLKKQKEDWLRSNTQVQRKQLEALDHLNRDLGALEVEINEAIEAGSCSLDALKNAKKHLDSAKSMSTWDTFLGGGLIATAMKHSSLNESEDAIHKAQLALHRFEAELQDVSDSIIDGLNVDRGSFLTFADYFFDDLFSEWTIHSRINSSIENVNKMTQKVKSICDDLEEQRASVHCQIEKANEEIDHLILSC